MKTKKMVLTAFFVALGMVLPFLTGQIPQIGKALSPLHLPALMAGFILGAPLGALVGFVLPLLRSAVFGMPIMFPMAVAMAFELATYGFVSGLAYKLLKKMQSNLKGDAARLIQILLALIAAMLCGRVAYGAVNWLLLTINNESYTFALFISGTITNAIPGILLQLVLIPTLIFSLEKAKIVSVK